MKFGVIRADLDELRSFVYDLEPERSPEISDPNPPFFSYDRPGRFSYLEDEWGEIKTWLDIWIPELLNVAIDEDFFVARLKQQGQAPDVLSETRGFISMLEGKVRGNAAFFRKADPQRVERARAWIAENPNGTR